MPLDVVVDWIYIRFCAYFSYYLCSFYKLCTIIMHIWWSNYHLQY